jgi:hypothetical protein
VTALAAWERAVHRATCAICRSEHVPAEEQERLCDATEAEKERCRIVFRDLCDELGFVPTGHGIGLPAEDHPCCQGLGELTAAGGPRRNRRTMGS